METALDPDVQVKDGILIVNATSGASLRERVAALKSVLSAFLLTLRDPRRDPDSDPVLSRSPPSPQPSARQPSLSALLQAKAGGGGGNRTSSPRSNFSYSKAADTILTLPTPTS